MNTYRANGKLLLTGEYLVLKGALALALPTKLGQTMTVETVHAPSLRWDAYKPNGLWFSASFNPETLEITACDDPIKAEQLAQILKAVRTLNPSVFEPGLHFETRLDFDPEWGLGSSSTLISNLAQWAGVNPYTLLEMTFGGSGYDIACATANSAIYYQLENNKPKVDPVDFNPPFADHLFFVYQGKKQRSSNEVKSFNQQWRQAEHISELQTISELSLALPTVTYFEDFLTLLQLHENILAQCLDRTPVQQQFPDFDGVLKSLGAWGGDFILAATGLTYDKVDEYFKNKGLDTLFSYHDIIL